MKIYLDLETADVRDMVEQYFAGKGFEVRNIEQVCAAFEDAYPSGLTVEARPTATPALVNTSVNTVAASAVLVDVPETAVPVGVTTEGNLVVTTATKSNPRLNFSDIMDPSMHGNAPTRDELLLETQREIQELLNASKHIERERTNSHE